MSEDTTTDDTIATAAGASGRGIDRRTVIAAAGAVGAAGVLAACSNTNPAPSTSPAPANTKGGQALASVADVPVGGGKIIEEPPVVVTQPTKGEFAAFSAICPHQGCIVNEVTADTIICPCHGSEFSAATGAVLVGPAATGLDPIAIKVEGGEILGQT